MCRLVAYLGHNALIEDVLVKPSNSLLKQSLHARETDMPTNGDGFGLSWYAPSISKEPALFRSIQPAWNDNNLLHLAAKIKSPCFVAHVRAASAGGVSQFNCHPFTQAELSFAHNGGIFGFSAVKRHLRRLLDNDIYEWVKGQTDSEHAFALFLQLAREQGAVRFSVMQDVLRQTLAKIEELVDTYTDGGASNLNFILSNGRELLACRYHSHQPNLARSLHFSSGGQFKNMNGRPHMTHPDGGKIGAVLVASERLNDFEADWHDVPGNHLIYINEQLEHQIIAL